jgi:hypothetical protein
MIAEPKERQRNDDGGRNREKREPRKLPFVGKPASRLWFAIHFTAIRKSQLHS